jgi:hypothetical protein
MGSSSTFSVHGELGTILDWIEAQVIRELGNAEVRGIPAAVNPSERPKWAAGMNQLRMAISWSLRCVQSTGFT